jgi:hypothetical protein
MRSENLKFQLHTFRSSRAERSSELDGNVECSLAKEKNKEIALQDNTSSIKFLALQNYLPLLHLSWGGFTCSARDTERRRRQRAASVELNGEREEPSSYWGCRGGRNLHYQASSLFLLHCRLTFEARLISAENFKSSSPVKFYDFSNIWHFHYFRLAFPPQGGRIGRKRAKQKFQGKLPPKLKYLLTPLRSLSSSFLPLALFIDCNLFKCLVL